MRFLEKYDAIEIAGIHQGNRVDLGDGVIPDSYCVYLHLKTGGTKDISEFNTLPEAECYARKLSRKSGFEIYNYA